MFLTSELIKKKRSGREHSAEEIRYLIDGYTNGTVPDYQISAWLMAVFFKGMTTAETASLTEAMLNSGRTVDFSHLGRVAVDKHSTGGVGDKTSLILAPIVAAAGVPVPMISGRGLGHTGGTLDKLESIPGFNTQLTIEAFALQVEKYGLALAGQTTDLCPADRKIYALRDVTGTVESLPLICASIMSKKLAEGIGALVLDVKFGSGAFMKTQAQAAELAENLMAIGAAHGKKVSALLTNMEQPLGRFIGNALEVGECIAILQGTSYLGRHDFEDCRELSLELAAQMIWLGGRAQSAHEGREIAEQILVSGGAWKVFQQVCQLQGGDLTRLPSADQKMDVFAPQAGFVAEFDSEKIGVAAIALGAGRARTTDRLDPAAGIEVHRKLGDTVAVGDRLFTLYASSGFTGNGDRDESSVERRFQVARNLLFEATTISLQKPIPAALIAARKAGACK